MRLQGREASISNSVKRLSSRDGRLLHHYDVASELGRMYGVEAVVALVDALPAGVARAWARLALADMSDGPEAKLHAECAMRDGFPAQAWLACLRAGADPAMFSRQTADLGELTEGVLSEDIQFHAERLRLWRTEIALASITGDEEGLRRAELRIIPSSWFRKWLCFCLVLVRQTSTPDELLDALKQLSENVEVFKGKPRGCDLYALHDEIQTSFGEMLVRLDGERWVAAINVLAKISAAVSTWLRGSRSGPLPLDVMFDLCLDTADSEDQRIAASELAQSVLGPDTRSGEFYDTHAHDNLLLARIHAAAGRRSQAAAAWSDACTYLAGYGWHKDVTVYDVLDPLEALGKADPTRTRECIHRAQRIVEGVLVHTDHKETGHAIHKWIDLAAEIHPAGALSFLVRREIGEVPAFGDLDHAISKALTALAGRVSQIEVASGWLAAGSVARSEAGAAIAACEKAAESNARAGRILWHAVVASLDGDGVGPPQDCRTLLPRRARVWGNRSRTLEAPQAWGDSKSQRVTRRRIASWPKRCRRLYSQPPLPRSKSRAPCAPGGIRDPIRHLSTA